MIWALIGTLLALLFNPFGMMTVLLGFLLFIVGPLIYRATGYGRVFVGVPLWLVARIMKRGAIVVSEHNDIFLKRMSFDDLGVETIRFGDERKEFEDPDGALHTWKGMTFALADEVTGVLFDPRHAALGQKKAAVDERGEGKVYATESEYADTGVSEWVKGVFEMPTQHELVDLADVRHLVDGGERSEYPKRVEELYKNSRIPLSSGTRATKFIYPILGFLGTFGGIWLIMDQLGGSEAATDPTVVSGLFFIATLKQLIPLSKLKAGLLTTVKVVVLLTLTIVPISLIAVFFGPLIAISLTILFIGGYLLVPVVALLTRIVGPLARVMSNLLLTLSFMGYEKPVFVWEPDGYKIRDYEKIDGVESVNWYGLGNSLVGFTFKPTQDAWDAEVMSQKRLKNIRMESVKDTKDSNIPSGQVPLNLSHRGKVGPFGPKHPSPRNYYLHSGIALSRFEDSAMGEKSMKRLTQAKEKFGEDGFGIPDKTILYATIFTMLMGIGLGVFTFIL